MIGVEVGFKIYTGKVFSMNNFPLWLDDEVSLLTHDNCKYCIFVSKWHNLRALLYNSLQEDAIWFVVMGYMV